MYQLTLKSKDSEKSFKADAIRYEKENDRQQQRV
jgi:hypothetical protein